MRLGTCAPSGPPIYFISLIVFAHGNPGLPLPDTLCHSIRHRFHDAQSSRAPGRRHRAQCRTALAIVCWPGRITSSRYDEPGGKQQWSRVGRFFYFPVLRFSLRWPVGRCSKPLVFMASGHDCRERCSLFCDCPIGFSGFAAAVFFVDIGQGLKPHLAGRRADHWRCCIKSLKFHPRRILTSHAHGILLAL